MTKEIDQGKFVFVKIPLNLRHSGLYRYREQNCFGRWVGAKIELGSILFRYAVMF